jgi:RNase P/RNase MRP subunit p30
LSYFESRLSIVTKNLNKIKQQLEFCEKLGLKNLILEPENSIKNIQAEFKKKINNLTKINLFYRITLRPSGLNELKQLIRGYNNFTELLSVETLDKETQIYAAKDSRVDILLFSDQEILKTLSRGTISLVKQSGSYIEFSLAPIMVANKTIQSKNFRNLYRSIKLVRSLKANYIISGNFKNLFDYRHPRALISLCNSMLEIPLNEAKKVFRDNPLNLLKRVQSRLDSNNITSGVRIIKGGG